MNNKDLKVPLNQIIKPPKDSKVPLSRKMYRQTMVMDTARPSIFDLCSANTSSHQDEAEILSARKW